MINISEIQLFEHDTAKMIAEGVVSMIKPYCESFIIAGGLRRGLPQVPNIDIIVQPKDVFQDFHMSCALGSGYKHVMSSKTKHHFNVFGINVDVWLAVTDRQFEVLKLIRTGSAGFIRNLCEVALEKSMALRYSYKEGLCGLYGAAKAWQKDDLTGQSKQKVFVNPMRKVAYKEEEIITKIMENGDYLDPKSRNLGWEEDITNEI